MGSFDLYITGLSNIDFGIIAILLLGTISGVLVGALPGLTATMAIAVMVPLTYSMSPEMAFALLMGVFCGAMYGGAIPAVLANIPGTPSAIMTALDGYPMGQKGEGGKAIGIATIASFIGGIISVVILTVFAPMLASFALEFSAQEYFAVSLLGLSIVAFISSGTLTKGLLSAAIGLMLATIGMDPIMGFERFTFGNVQLMGGLELIPVMVGLFGLGTVLSSLHSDANKDGPKEVKTQVGRIIPTWKDFKSNIPPIFRGSLIGSFVGAIPAAGGTIAGIMAYGIEKRVSKHSEKFGTGIPQGVAAPESANNATSGSSLIPMLTLGIPGDAITAILIGALIMHGLQPGPLLFENQPDFVSTLFIMIVIANFIFLFFGLFGAKVVSKIMMIPSGVLLPIILMFCVVGTFSLRNNIFDVGVLIVFGILGFIFYKVNVPTAPLVLGFILGPLLETNFRRTLILSDGNITEIFTRGISGSIMIIALLILFAPLLIKFIKNIILKK